MISLNSSVIVELPAPATSRKSPPRGAHCSLDSATGPPPSCQCPPLTASSTNQQSKPWWSIRSK